MPPIRRHPFAVLRDETGKLPSIWARDFRHVFLFTPDDIRSRIKYVEGNPVRDGTRRQSWPFVAPYAGRAAFLRNAAER